MPWADLGSDGSGIANLNLNMASPHQCAVGDGMRMPVERGIGRSWVAQRWLGILCRGVTDTRDPLSIETCNDPMVNRETGAFEVRVDIGNPAEVNCFKVETECLAHLGVVLPRSLQ